MPLSAHAPLVVSIIASVLGALAMCLLVARYGLTPAADENADSAARRLIVTRFGHAFAGVCFAATGILGLVALVAPVRQAPPPPPQVVIQPDRATEARVQVLAAELKAIATRVEQTETRVGTVDSTTRRLADEVTSVNVRTRQMERALVPPPRRAAVPEVSVKESREAASPREVIREPARLSERPALLTADAPTSTPLRVPPSPDPTVAPAMPPPVVRTPEPPAAPRTPLPAARAPEPRALPTLSRAPEYGAVAPRASEPPYSADGGAAAAKPDDGLGDKLRDDWKKIRDGFQTAGDDFKSAIRDLGRKLWR